MLMEMGPLGWAVSLVVGFLVGGLLFLSIKTQVDYVVHQKGPTWVMPAAMYARMAFVAVVLILTSVLVPPQKLAGAVLGALVGIVIARVLVSRMVGRAAASEDDAPEEDADGRE
ncbi:MAG: hypothetical protein GXY85_03450 [Candidatus Brocadiaceae bacterium]|nr:hypothetical protein [Candidatus Brocadiaceae bacterium]